MAQATFMLILMNENYITGGGGIIFLIPITNIPRNSVCVCVYLCMKQKYGKLKKTNSNILQYFSFSC